MSNKLNALQTDMLLSNISKSMRYGSKCRVYFQQFDRSPVFGKFVELADARECLNKHMVRFVSESKSDEFEATGDEKYTRLMTIDSLKDVKLY